MSLDARHHHAFLVALGLLAGCAPGDAPVTRPAATRGARDPAPDDRQPTHASADMELVSAATRPDPDALPSVVVAAAEGAPTPGAPGPRPPSQRRAAAVAVVAECRPLRVPTASAVILEEDLVYNTVGGVSLAVDIARPRDASSSPAVILIHGGAWRLGEKAHVRSMALALAARGYAGVALDYRLADAPERVFPAAVADARCAVRWLRAHAAEHAIDPDRIGALGFSAGGHLAALLATAPDAQGLDQSCATANVSPRIQAAVAWFAPFDLRRPTGSRATDRAISQFLGAEPAVDAERATLASPIAHVDVSDPPMLLVHGTDDRVVDIRESRRMRSALRAARVAVTLVELEGAGHGFGLLSPRPEHRPAVCTTLAFLDATIGDR